jgi:hypothetical protein
MIRSWRDIGCVTMLAAALLTMGPAGAQPSQGLAEQAAAPAVPPPSAVRVPPRMPVPDASTTRQRHVAKPASSRARHALLVRQKVFLARLAAERAIARMDRELAPGPQRQ